jgi:hypothetical protein
MSLALAKNESMWFSCPEKENEKSMYVCQFNNMVWPNEKCRCVYAPVYIKKWQCEDK